MVFANEYFGLQNQLDHNRIISYKDRKRIYSSVGWTTSWVW